MNPTKKEKQIVRRNRRLYVSGGVYFITSVTWKRKPLFQEDAEVEILRQTLRNVKQLYPFTMQAYTFLPDHFHLMLRPIPPVKISQILHSFKRNVTWNYKKAIRNTAFNESSPMAIWKLGPCHPQRTRSCQAF
ncbi:transposase [Candidatus Poribacteria bacterium]|nr:transposase [Candidatus Poribacteria bacterium]